MIRFEAFEIDETRRELRRDGRVVPIQPKVLDLLVYLVRHRDRVVSQAELLRALWPDAVVTSASLARALKEVRRALGDDGASQRWIRTHRRGGYRFLGDVESPAAARGSSRYVGREPLLAALDAALARSLGGAGEIALLVGPSGIGKTRTASELADRAEHLGARVAWARCADSEDAPPLWPWRRLAAALDERVPEGGERFQHGAEIAAAVERAAARGPLLLIVDDLHEAESSSAALVGFLAPELRRLPVLLVATLRREALERRVDLARLHARLRRLEFVSEHELPAFDAGELARFVAQRAGAAPPTPVVSALLGATLGNPLWVDEVLRGGLAGGSDGVDVDWHSIVSVGFEQVLRERLARLSASVRGALEAAAVLGEEFDAELVADVAKHDVGDALDEARREGLLLASEPDLARHRFAHASFREALVAAIPAALRAELHVRAARALEARLEEGRGVEAIARHWLAAGARGDPARAVEWAWRAGLRALAAHGWAQAVRLFERAVALAESPAAATPARHCDLLLRLAEARTHLGDRDGARAAAEAAAALAAAHGWSARGAEATLLWAGPPLRYTLPDAAVSQRLADAQAKLGTDDVALAARLLARSAAEHVLDPDRETAERLRRRAVDTALACGDAEVLAEVLMTPYSGIWEHVEPARRLALADACIDRASAQGNRIAQGRGRLLRLGELLGLGDVERFDAEVDAVESTTVEEHEPTGRYQVLLHRTTRALLAGHLARAERLAEEALALGRRVEIAGAFELFAATLTVLRREQGRLGELAGVRPPLFVGHPSPAARVIQLWAFAEWGDHAEARRRLESVIAEDLPTLGLQPTGVANAALLARSCFLLDVRAPAGELASLLAPYAERIVLRGTLTAHGPASYFLALLAWLDGDRDRVGPLFDHARRFCQRMGAAGWGAQADFDAARWLAEQGDAVGAHTLAERAARTASSLGMAALQPLAEALHQRLG